jgi:ribosome-associated protein
MILSKTRQQGIENEFIFATSRSSGAGGQNVNKVNTKVELRFHVLNSFVLNEQEKNTILEKLRTRINKDGFVVMTCQTERSQLRNKEKIVERFFHIVETALRPRKKRKATKRSKSSIEKRLDSKLKNAQKKSNRSKIAL